MFKKLFRWQLGSGIREARALRVKGAICKRLKLSPNAGLGWRLHQATIKEDVLHPGTYYLGGDDVFGLVMLAQALNVLADTSRMKFVAAANFQ
jgi:hypothetical protein